MPQWCSEAVYAHASAHQIFGALAATSFLSAQHPCAVALYTAKAPSHISYFQEHILQLCT